VATQGLLTLLDVQPLAEDVYEGRAPDTGSMRTFGGLVVAQALMAAARTAPDDRTAHSLHATFLRGADPSSPITYVVNRPRDGRAFSSRTVSAEQDGRTLLLATTSFHTGEPGLEHEDAPAVVPSPETLPAPVDLVADGDDRMQAWIHSYVGLHPVDVRFVTEAPPTLARRGGAEARVQVWVRSTESLPADPALHAAALTYASDLFLLTSALLPHALLFGTGDVRGSTLDHGIWFHRHVRADDWLLFEQESPWAGNGRALSRGVIRDLDGRIVASMAQEGLLRQPAPEGGHGPA
jgi:acyl-CoA thioesterase-2